MLRKIIKDYTPTTKALDTPQEQARAIQDLYDQMREFFRWLNSPEFATSHKGEKGDKGDPGLQGIQGIPGAKGKDGLVGPQGPRGLKGEPGAKGDKGDRGERGLQGEKGADGLPGPRGLTGPVGATGPRGEKGEKGDIGEWLGVIECYPTYADMVRLETNPVNAGFYLVAEDNAERGDVYVYNGFTGRYVFLNNLIYDLMFQLVQGPTGRNFLTAKAGEHINEHGVPTVTDEYYRDNRGYLHTTFTFDYLKGSGIASKEFTQNDEDSGISVLKLTFDDGQVITINIRNGKGIKNINKTGTVDLIDTYTITYSDNTTKTFNVSNGRGIVRIEKTSTNLITDVYTITYNDNTTSTYTIVNGRGIVTIQKSGTVGLVDTYTINYNDNTTSTFTITNGNGIKSIALINTNLLVDTYRITFDNDAYTDYQVTNGRGIVSIAKTGREGLEDVYTINYNNDTTSTFKVKSCTPYEEAVAAGYDKSVETFYGIINGNVWIGPGQNYSDVYDNDDYKYEDINVNNPLNIECIQDYIYVIYPADSEFMFNLTMSGFSVPMEPADTTTLQDYVILKSVNQYDGNFNIVI